MKQKINLCLIIIAILAVLITTMCVTMVCYGLFQKQIRNDLRTNALIIKGAGMFDLAENEKALEPSTLRITWIDKDGSVLYDNDNTTLLENHKDRPEVKEAFETGMGESERISTTMNTSTFYCAVKLEDGTVVRVSTQAKNIVSVFFSTFPILGMIGIVIAFLCIFISRMLTKQLLEPIEETAQNLENTTSLPAYNELVPFVQMIRKQHEDILLAAKSRQDFTANVSHELKTPLTAISGYAELIENQMVEPNQEIYFAKEIGKNANRLLNLIDDIIRLSELDHSQEGNGFEEIDLYELVKECMTSLKENARQRNVEIELTGKNCKILANRRMMIELVENLTQNAIRYNVYGGTVMIIVEIENEKPILIVKDTGIGIPKEDQARVFERFYRVDKSRSKERGGTGLGLAIVKHIVELHDAKIFLDSEVSKGTTIKVNF